MPGFVCRASLQRFPHTFTMASFHPRWVFTVVAHVMQIERAHLFDLSTDPREEVNLVEGTGAKGCCPRAAETAPSTSGAAVREGELPASCFEAAQYPASLLKGGGSAGKASLDRATVLTTAVCCHLQTAAVVFARKNMEFFGR